MTGTRAQFREAADAAAVHLHPLSLLLTAALPARRVRIRFRLAVHGVSGGRAHGDAARPRTDTAFRT